ncbi:AAA family ATPase [Shewanella sp. Isolate13]|uniref:AAA family ATPase n=1 Tax=Shewanella sp. Isolate13 TaxID=2908531 RepID=UPI001EFCAA43|nr:AAA family ATPase [Shewanella sp. Isolate13]MCG9732367.1 AAA family ATPase [Shewanella sp. Isolate13]
MKFRRIELRNFRQFYGTQEIFFSTDSIKNVTLIHAENGTGKTAFLNAILWCFYEIFTSNFKDPKSLLNKVAKSEGVKSYGVSVEFEDDGGRIYLVQRAFGEGGQVFRIFEVIDDSYTEVDKANSFINSVIPKDMAKYFFFQGEGIGKMSGSRGDSVVKTAVREIMGFTIAELALKDVRNIKKEYQKSFSNADKSGVLSKVQNQIVSLQDSIERNRKQLTSVEASIALYESKLEEIEESLANSDSTAIKHIHGLRVKIESQLSREKQLLTNSQKEKRVLVTDFATTVFGYKLSELALDFIDESEFKGTVPAPYNEQLVTDILKESICICGCDVKPGTDAFNRITDMLKQAADPRLESRIQKARAQLTYIKNDAAKAKSRFTTNIKSLADSESAIVNLKHELEELNVKIKGVQSLEDIQGIEKERERLRRNLKEEIRSSERARSLIKSEEAELVLKKSELNRLDTFSTEMNKYKQLTDYAEKVEEALNTTLSKAEKDVEYRIISKVNKYLEYFVRQDYKAKLNPATFDIRLVDRNDNIVPESDGQALLLSLTFIASLIELSRERKNAQGQILTPGAIAPFVIDAPFGDLDNKYKGHVAKAIPNSVEQVILLLSSSHWEGAVEDNIREKIGVEYNMVLEESSDANNKSLDSITVLGKEYDTVRYGQMIDCTVLEKVGCYV